MSDSPGGHSPKSVSIDTILKETRVFQPSEDFRRAAHVADREDLEKVREAAQRDPLKFWEDAAREIHWFQKWDKTLEWNPPFAKWFIGGKTNAAYNCLDRHLAKSGEKIALVFEGEDGSAEKISYRELHARVCQLAHALEQKIGLKAGDTAAIYLPLIPEAVIAMLACARIGVAHSVIFAGFASHAIHDRVLDAECKVVLTADLGYRRGQVLDLRRTVAAGIENIPCVRKVIVLRRKEDTPLGPRETDWSEFCKDMPRTHQAQPFDSEHPLYILYTSGTTGKPKGIVHSTGGYLVGTTITSKWIFDLKPSDVYWCTADIGWVTGHSYIVYGLLSLGMTNVIFEGALNYPHPGRIWEIIDKHQVSILYTAPTAIRSFMRSGDEHPQKFKLSSLRLLGSVGEPINPEAGSGTTLRSAGAAALSLILGGRLKQAR